MVQGGERNSKSINITMAGTAWKLISALQSANKTTYGNKEVSTGIERNVCPIGDDQACINLKMVRNGSMNGELATNHAKTPVQNADKHF